MGFGKRLQKSKNKFFSVLLCMKFLFFCECFLFATNKTNKIEQKKIII